jgi:tetratricopeptide (TPR) repeat protein
MPPLVGRDRELAELTSTFDDIDGGLGRLVFLAGEAGIGKTRLAEEVARRATARGYQVAWGRAWEGGGTPAFWPWTQIARALATSERPAPAFATPELPLERFEVFDAIARYYADVSRARPAMIVLEDLHVADRASLALLSFLATQLRNLRMLVLGTYREGELALVDTAGDVVRAARHGRTLPLGRLDRSDVGALARALGIGDASAADRVHQATDGLPFFACEVLQQMRARPSDALPIPNSVRASVRDRMALVDPTARSIVEAAAALGRDVTPGVLAELGGAPVDDALAQAHRAGLLEDGASGYRFVHALVRDAIHDDLPPARRTALHRGIAEALARRHGTEPPLDEIAHHYLAAGPASLPDAARAACAAAEQCIRQLAYEDAIAIVDRVLAAVDAGAADPMMRAELLLVAGSARLRAGDDAGGRHACDEVAACARRLGSPELLARAALAYGSVLRPARVDPLLVGMLEEALASLPAGRLFALVEARLAGALQPAFDPTVPIAMARSAIDSARELDPASRLAVLVGAGAALQDVGDPAERLEIDRETLALAIAHHDLAITIRARQRLVFDHVSLGDPAAADLEIASLQQLVAPLPARWHWPIALMRALRALGEARFDDVATHVALARSLVGPRVDPGMDRLFRLRAFFEGLLRDQDGAIADRWSEAAPTFHQHPVPELCLALVHARNDRIDDAREVLASTPREAIIAFAADPPTSILLAEVIDATGDAALADAVAPRIEPLAGRIAVWSWLAMTCLGPTERALGLLARARGRLDEAARWLADAEERATRANLQLHLPRIAYERGATLLAAGHREAGLACLTRAAAGAARLGLPELGARIERARRASPPVPRAAPAGDVVVTVHREGELWRVAGGGESHALRDSRGMQLLARLVELPERELHVLDLGSDTGEAIDTGDAGDVLDATARAAYRRRIGELREQLEDAEDRHDLGRVERARDELERIEAELVAAVGLGGRGRRAASATERARSNVQRRLAEAIRRIAQVSPALGQHLERCVRTGIYCRYSPANPRSS